MTYVYGGPEMRKAHRTSPTELLTRMFERFPDRDFEEHLEKFSDAVRSSDDMLEPILRYFVRNAWSDFRRRENAQRARAEPAREERRRAAIAATVERIRSVVIGDILMANGKTVNDCTGTEMKKFGGAWTRIGEIAKRRKVGDVLSEQALAEIVHKGGK